LPSPEVELVIWTTFVSRSIPRNCRDVRS
jgi:hypothetical protein